MNKSFWVWFFIAAVILGGMLFIGGAKDKVHAAASCTALVSWDKATVDQGGAATETWAIQGADSATGRCGSTSVSNLNFGPQSFTYANIQNDITCSVTGYIGGVACNTAEATIKVNATSGGGGTCSATTLAASGITHIYAQLNSAVTGNPSNVVFHWGTSAANLDQTASATGGAAALLGLTPSTTYYFQVAADTSCGKETGAILSFKTAVFDSCPQGSCNTGGAPSTTAFPPNGSYTISASSSSVQANFSYAPPVPTAVFFANQLRTFFVTLGNLGKNAFGTPTAAPGPAFRWDISDPLHMKAPDVVGLSYNAGEPQNMRGPINSTGWAHLDHWLGSAAAESADGEARYVEHMGTGRDTVASFPAGGGGNFGGIHWGTALGSAVMLHTSEDKYFAYGPYQPRSAAENRSNFVNALGVWDLTDPSGGEDVDPFAQISWANTQALGVLNVSGKGDFLAGLTSSAPGGLSGLLRVAKINPESGKISSSKTLSVPKFQAIFGSSFNNSALQTAVYNGKGYIFITEDIGFKNGGAVLGSIPGTVTIGVYELTPSSLALRKVSAITVEDLTSQSPYLYKIVSAPDGTVAPLLVVPALQAGRPDWDAWEENYDLRVYGLKNTFASAATTFRGSDVSLVIPRPGPGQDFKSGDVVVNQFPFNGFLSAQGSKTYLNLFRNAYIIAGFYNGVDTPYGVFGMGMAGSIAPMTQTVGRQEPGLAGPGSLRADVIEVSSIVGGSSSNNGGGSGNNGGLGNSTSTATSTNSGGGGGIVIPPPPGSSNPCFNSYRNLCDQINQLQQQICKLVPTAAICTP
jgi:hypothetical protein